MSASSGSAPTSAGASAVPSVAVAVRGLTFSYPDGTHALDGLDLEIGENERVGLLGANGAGKSTLLLHLNGILASSPKVSILGLAIEKRNLREIRRRVGLVFQNPDDQLFCPTVFDDVAFGPRNLGLSDEEVHVRVDAALDEVGLHGCAERSSLHLSVGQKKRVAIASVLAMRCEVFVLDEPSSGLDPRGRRELIELLLRLGRTQVIATHDLDLVGQLCDRAVVLSKGRVVATGAPARILGDRDLLARFDLA